MSVPDWRTDNWAGHKPTSYRYNDPNLHFPRSTRDVGWGWFRMLDENIPEVENRYTIYQIMLFVIGVFIICAIVPEIREFFVALGSLILDWWNAWDAMLGVQNG